MNSLRKLWMRLYLFLMCFHCWKHMDKFCPKCTVAALNREKRYHSKVREFEMHCGTTIDELNAAVDRVAGTQKGAV